MIIEFLRSLRARNTTTMHGAWGRVVFSTSVATLFTIPTVFGRKCASKYIQLLVVKIAEDGPHRLRMVRDSGWCCRLPLQPCQPQVLRER